MNFRILMEALFSLHGGSLDYAIACTSNTRVAETTVAQDKTQGKQNGSDPCGWIGVTVSPMTTAFAEAIGMVKLTALSLTNQKPLAPPPTQELKQAT
jgi:hypothetical protein